MFELEGQCCDAWTYLAAGEKCTANGFCHDALRPAGSALWFSLPSLLNLDPAILIAGNAILLLCSVLQFFFCFLSLPYIQAWRTITKSGFFLILLIIHWVFLRPTFFNTLSDTPSALFCLNGSAALILANQYRRKKTFSVIAGICWGMAYWIRSFYLYPLCLAVLVAIALAKISRKNSHLNWLAIALIPLCIQISIMYRNYGTFSYINSNLQAEVTAMHLNSSAIAYDTLLNVGGHFWMPEESEDIHGVQYSLATGNYASIAKILWRRLYFYLGTYNERTYIASNYKNIILPVCAEKFSDIPCWFQTGGSYEKNPDPLPQGFNGTVRFFIDKNSNHAESMKWDTLYPRHLYTFSIYAWADKPGFIKIFIKRNNDGHVLEEKTVSLTDQPTRYTVSGKTLETDDYTFGISLLRKEGHADSVFIWGAQLNDGEISEFEERLPLQGDEIRKWWPWLFAMHGVIILICAIFLWRNRLTLTKTISSSVLFLATTMICGQTLIIIAEQRFAIVPLISLWILFVFACLTFFTSRGRLYEPA